MMESMTFILAGDNLKRIMIEDENDEAVITLDLHGMDCRTARRVVKSIIAMYRFSFDLVLIHGYNHGTVLKNMLNNSFDNERIISKSTPVYNPGVTRFRIAAPQYVYNID